MALTPGLWRASMERFRYEENELQLIEKSLVPFAIFQKTDEGAVTVALSDGCCDIFGLSREEAHDE